MYVRSSHANVSCVVMSKDLAERVFCEGNDNSYERLGVKRFDTSLSTTGNLASFIP